MGIVGLKLWRRGRLIRLGWKGLSKRSGTELALKSLFICLLILTLSTQPVRLPDLSANPLPLLTYTNMKSLIIVAPATGTPETGGWTTRELRTIIRGLEGINFVAADIVEVAPAYDTNAEHTTMAAADTLFEVMSLMVKRGPMSVMGKGTTRGDGEMDGKRKVMDGGKGREL